MKMLAVWPLFIATVCVMACYVSGITLLSFSYFPMCIVWQKVWQKTQIHRKKSIERPPCSYNKNSVFLPLRQILPNKKQSSAYLNFHQAIPPLLSVSSVVQATIQSGFVNRISFVTLNLFFEILIKSTVKVIFATVLS